MPTAGSSNVSGRRRHTSAACMGCRKRKVRCDNQKPKCSNCRLYDANCVFVQDGRRLRPRNDNDGASAEHAVPNGLHDEAMGRTTQQASKDQRDVGAFSSASSSSPHDAIAACKSPLPDVAHFQDASPAQFSAAQSEFIAALSRLSPNAPCFQADGAGRDMFGPLAHDYVFTTSGDADLDYWVRSAEGSGHPLDFMDLSEPLQPLAVDQACLVGSEPVAITTGCASDAMMNATATARCTATREPESQQPTAPPQSIDTAPQQLAHSQDAETSKMSLDAEVTTMSSDAEVTRQISSRTGKLQQAEDGQMRYYGATSNLHILHPGLSALTQPSIRSIQIHGESAIAQANLSWPEDADHERHLSDLFFAWHNPFLNVIDKSYYEHARKTYDDGNNTGFYSLCLKNAILAIGSAYGATAPPSLPDNPSHFFSSRAKVYLDIEMDSPSEATLQALLLLSTHEVAQVHDSRAMAVQLSLDLGLHLDLDISRPFAGPPTTNLELAQVRRNLFWAVKTYDRMWSSFSGRPSLMRSLDYSVGGPSARNYVWKYVADSSQMTLPSEADFHVAGRIHVYVTELTMRMGKFTDVLYSRVLNNSEEQYRSVQEFALELRQWKDALPTSISLQENLAQSQIRVPAVFELHLLYEEAVILLHRPILSLSKHHTDNPCTDDPSSIARGVCFKAATNISKILAVYRRFYGLKRAHLGIVHTVLTAALIHTYICSIHPEEANTGAQDCLLICLQALGEMGQTFRSASRALEVITTVRSEWKTLLSK